VVQRSVFEGLGLRDGDDWYCILRDQASGLEFLRNNRQIRDQGLYVDLGAYGRHVFVDVRDVQDTDGRYRRLAEYLGGRGVPSIEEALRGMLVRPVQQPFEELMSPALLSRVIRARAVAPNGTPDAKVLAEVEERVRTLVEQARSFSHGGGDADGDRQGDDGRAAIAADDLGAGAGGAAWLGRGLAGRGRAGRRPGQRDDRRRDAVRRGGAAGPDVGHGRHDRGAAGRGPAR
jgi:hypothetical protein